MKADLHIVNILSVVWVVPWRLSVNHHRLVTVLLVTRMLTMRSLLLLLLAPTCSTTTSTSLTTSIATHLSIDLWHRAPTAILNYNLTAALQLLKLLRVNLDDIARVDHLAHWLWRRLIVRTR